MRKFIRKALGIPEPLPPKPAPFQVEAVYDLKRTTGGIDMMVKFNHMPEAIPFHATPHDMHGHGRELYLRAIAGKYGPIA